MNGIFRKAKNENGQAVVEMAIILPILLLLICGILDFGWLFYNKLIVNNYCREATRYAIVNGDNETAASLETKIKDKISQIEMPGVDDNVIVDITFSNPSNLKRSDVTVNVTCFVSSLTPITNVISVNGKIKVGSQVTMRME